jgi:hypothetical protein
MAAIDDIKNILLRVETNPDLVTKGAILEPNEVDENFIEVYEALKALLGRVNPEGAMVVDNDIVFTDALGNDKFKYEVADGVLYLKYWDGALWQTMEEKDLNNNTIKNFPFPLNRFYTAIELTGTPLNIPVNAGDTEDVTNVTNDAFSEIVGCHIFDFTDDVLTVQNIPTGFKAWVKLTCTINFLNSEASQTEFIINGKSFFYKPDDSVSTYQSTFSHCFLVENTDEFDIKAKNPNLSNFELDFISIFLDLELIKLEPII